MRTCFDLAELSNQFLFTDVRIATRTAMDCAAVIDVLPLLRLRRERTSAPAARHEPGERMSSLRMVRVVRREHLLHAVEEVARDERLVESLMR
jgi:hypothetical protein